MTDLGRYVPLEIFDPEGTCDCFDADEVLRGANDFPGKTAAPGELSGSSGCLLDGVIVSLFNNTSRSGASSSAGGAFVRLKKLDPEGAAFVLATLEVWLYIAVGGFTDEAAEAEYEDIWGSRGA